MRRERTLRKGLPVKFSKTQIAIPAAIVLAAAAAGGAQLWGQHVAETRVNETLASLPGGATGHYDELNYNVFTRTLRLSGLSITQGGAPLLSLRRLVLHHISGEGTDANPLQADSVHVTGLDAWHGGHRVAVGYAVVQKVALLAPGLPAPATTPLWLQAPGEGTLLSAASIEASDIASDDGTTLAALSAKGYDQGKLAQASARNFADRRGNRIASIAGTSIDLDGLDRIFDTGRYTPEAPAWTGQRPLIAHLTLSGFVTKGNHGDSTFDHLSMDGLAGRPFALSPTGAHTQTEAFRRDAAEALALGDVSLGNLTFSDSETGTTGHLGQLSLSGYQAGKLTLFALADFSLSRGKTQALGIGTLQLTQFDASGLLARDDGLSTQDWITAAQSGDVKLGALELGQAAVRLPEGQMVSVDRVKESVSGTNPIDARFSMQGLNLPASLSPQLQSLLEPIGMDVLVLDFEEAGRFDQKTGDTTLEHGTLTAEGLGSLSLSGQFTNLPRSLPDGTDPMAALGQVGIGHARATFTNQSLVQKIIAMMAKQSGRSTAEITSGARVAASFMAAAVVPGQANAGEQMSAFIANPKSLTLTASPEAPVPVSQLLGPDLRAAQDALKLQLSAN